MRAASTLLESPSLRLAHDPSQIRSAPPPKPTKIKFFSRITSGGKRSFQLVPTDITTNNLSLFAAVSDPVIIDPLSNDAHEIVPQEDGTYSFSFHPEHEYLVRAKTPLISERTHAQTWEKFCTMEELKKASNTRKRGPVHNRDVMVLLYEEKLYALDAACYHFGGPLPEGDIEDIGSHPCVICPWHRYRIALDTGEGMQLTEHGWVSKGVKQRVHEVKEEGGDVYVRLHLTQQEIASDHYACMGLYKFPANSPQNSIKTFIHSTRPQGFS